MDYKEQAELNKGLAAEWNRCSCIAKIGGMKPEEFLAINATAITDLLARAEKAETKVRGLERTHRIEKCDSGPDCVELGKVRKALAVALEAVEARAEAAEKEAERLRESLDFARTKDAEIVRLGQLLNEAKAREKNLIEAMQMVTARAEKMESERDEALSDLETVMAYGGGSLDTCQFCKNGQCYKRGGAKPCLPKWRGWWEK